MMRVATSAVFVALTATLVSSQPAEVKVLSAIGMRQVMLELGPRFERATGHKLAITFDSTGLIARRVTGDEQVDVVLINRSAIEPLAKDQKVIASSVTPIAASVAAVAVRKGAARPDISSPDAFRRMLLSAKAIARPSPDVGGSSGDHVVKVLEQLGIASEVNAKSVIITLGPDRIADSPGAAVANRQADVALHQLQELMAVPGLEIVGPFPGELQGNFVFSAALATNSRAANGGKALIGFLRTDAAREVMVAKGMQPIAPAPARAAILAAATDIVQKAHYCTFITVGEDGQPEARIVDPLAPDAAFTIWIATNPLTRKVDQIRRNPRVTLSCFDSATSSYVTILGRGALVTDAAEKQRHWKADWSQIYPNGARGTDVVLIRLTPARLEIVSESRGMVGDPKTWRPLSIEFASK